MMVKRCNFRAKTSEETKSMCSLGFVIYCFTLPRFRTLHIMSIKSGQLSHWTVHGKLNKWLLSQIRHYRHKYKINTPKRPVNDLLSIITPIFLFKLWRAQNLPGQLKVMAGVVFVYSYPHGPSTTHVTWKYSLIHILK